MYQNDQCNCVPGVSQIENGVARKTIAPAGPTLVYLVNEIGEALSEASKAVTNIDLKLYGPKPTNEGQTTPPINCMEDALKDIMNGVIDLKLRLNGIDSRL